MKSLYLVNNPEKISQCQSLINQGDSILLIEDAVVASNTAFADKMLIDQSYVLKEDLIARGLTHKADASWLQIDYDRFVQLTLEYEKVISWL